MQKVRIEKDIFIVDKYGVTIHAFVAGDVVDKVHFDGVLATNAVVEAPVVKEVEDSVSVMEVKILPQEDEVTEVKEEGVEEAEAPAEAETPVVEEPKEAEPKSPKKKKGK